MSLFTAPGFEGNWIGSWTVFYWAWWMSWAPFVAVFIAKISKGRTIRETVAATLLLPTLGDFLWYGVVGGAGISFDVTKTLSEHGLESAIFAIAQNLPMSGILAVFLIFLITTFFLTSANSAALALAMFVSKDEEPGKNLRAFWGIALGADEADHLVDRVEQPILVRQVLAHAAQPDHHHRPADARQAHHYHIDEAAHHQPEGQGERE